MSATDPIDLPYAHRLFSAECFNHAWSFIRQEGRSQEDNIRMLAASHASLWH